MLSTLLPGIRELRAPLAAGYVWLLAAWIAFEPRVPEAADATGLVATLYRLNDALSGFGLAVAASFAAYLIGSLSITLFDAPIRRQFIRPPRFGESLGPLVPFSEPGVSALDTLVRRTWDRMATTLALTGVSPGDVLELEGLSEASQRSSNTLSKMVIRKPARSLRSLADRVLRRRTEIQMATLGLSFDSSTALDPRHVRLIRTVVDEFDQILRTRLLGRDPDLFSAVDRHRAEVEFRIALIPPLFVLAVAVASTVDTWAIPLVVVAGLLACLGLFWDARERERNANDTLSGALADARVKSPTLEALEQRTSAIAKQPLAEKMQQAGADAVRAIGDLIDMLEHIDSNLSRAQTVADEVVELRDRTAPVDGFFSPAVVAERDRSLEEIAEASRLWSAAFSGESPAEHMEAARRHAQLAKESYSAFRRAAVNEIEGAAAAEPSPPATRDESVVQETSS